MRSIELGWLSRRDKGLPLPLIIFTPKLNGCSGYYSRPQNTESLVDGKFINLTNGLIVCEEDDGVDGTIAHEWRHHWQLFHFGKNDNPIQFDESIDYDLAIKKYFKDRMELDALLFSHRIAPNHSSEYWINLVKK